MVRSLNHRRLNKQPLPSQGRRKLLNPLTQRPVYLAGAIAVPAVLLSLGAPALSNPDVASTKRAVQATAQVAEPRILLAQAAYPTLAAGSTDESIRYLQSTLKLLGFYTGNVDGAYSQSTQAAVIRFQTAAGIAADGIVGPSTWDKLFPAPEEAQPIAASEVPMEVPVSPPAAAATPDSAEPAPNAPPVLRADAVGSAVSQLQSELQTLGYYQGEIDGGYGEQTEAAVRKFQSDQQLTVDGVVGQSTWDALSRALAQ